MATPEHGRSRGACHITAILRFAGAVVNFKREVDVMKIMG
jgi:hypothetical protein